jgi:hypothetical protein
MADRPILFSAPMVRAILAGTKTKTRRVVKPQPNNDPAKHHPIEPYKTPTGLWNWVLAVTGHGSGDPFACPYGKPGDRLWVRESFYAESPQTIFYRATHTTYEDDPRSGWKPSIHMPRWASRITLEITDVRVQRLQDISEADLDAEGIQELIDGGVDHDGTPLDTYRTLWDSINAKRAPWESNPWVWAITFRRIENG